MRFEEGVDGGEQCLGVVGAKVDEVGVVGGPGSIECFFVLL